MRRTTGILPIEGSFFIGCNYWASHAGTGMWSDWRPDIVEEDFRQLAAEGLQVLRVFPLWPDFQPIDMLYGVEGREKGIRLGESRLPDGEAGRAGVSSVMMDRFRTLVGLAEKHGLKLIVGLVTGWMSGRLFVPPALRGKSILTDPTAIQWQVRFVRYFVSQLKDEPSIVAWDLGNECNCMGIVDTREEAWVWTSSISNAIKSSDSSRPLVSGMHSLSPTGKWTMQDQGELTDILTTHPYPLWTPHVGVDPLPTIRPIVHAAAESLYYEHLGGKPCFAEEIGTMGPMISSDDIAGDFARASLFTLWAHGCHGMVWWCAYDQTRLNKAPYDWVAVEGELGLVTEDRKVKPVLKEMGRIRKFIDHLPFVLPPRETNAVCILNTNQDHWAAALGSFILAKQAGFDVDFQFEDQPLKQSDFYMLPSVSGVEGMPKQRWIELLRRVHEGASLYISAADGIMLDFRELTGLVVDTRSARAGNATVQFDGNGDPFELELQNPLKLTLRAERAEVLASEKDGNVAFSRTRYGKGTVYYLAFPVELQLIGSSESTYMPEAYPLYRVYRTIADNVVTDRIASTDYKHIGVTEHKTEDGGRIVVMINYSPEFRMSRLDLKSGWSIAKTHYGEIRTSDGAVVLPPNEAVVIECRFEGGAG